MENYIIAFFDSCKVPINAVFNYIFPEAPGTGVYVVGLSLLLFVLYVFKSGFKHAVKISLMVLFGLIFLLFAIHSLAKIFHLNISF